MTKNAVQIELNEELLKLIQHSQLDMSKFIEEAILEFKKSEIQKNQEKLLIELENIVKELEEIIENFSKTNKKNNFKNKESSFVQKSTVMLLILTFLAVGSAIALGMEYKKAKSLNISGNTNTIVSTALTIDYVSVSAELDDSSVAAISEDGLTFIWGVQANNGDVLSAEITLKNNANTEIVALIKAESLEDIEVKFSGNNVGKISENEWLVSIPGANAGTPGFKTFTQTLEISPDAEPGFYSISTSIESTSLKGLNTS